MNSLCTCCCDVENTCHFLLHRLNFLAERNTIFNKITNINSDILNQTDATITKVVFISNLGLIFHFNFLKNLFSHCFSTFFRYHKLQLCLYIGKF